MNRRTFQLAVLRMGLGVPSPRAARRPLLTVSGRLQRTNDNAGQSYAFGEEEFLALPQRNITTATIWAPTARFTGPALADVLAHVQAGGEAIRLSALNDYSVDVPWADLERYAPTLAPSRDGRRMGVAKACPGAVARRELPHIAGRDRLHMRRPRHPARVAERHR